MEGFLDEVAFELSCYSNRMREAVGEKAGDSQKPTIPIHPASS